MDKSASFFMEDEDVTVIRQNRQASNAAIIQKDVESVAKYWTDDFVQVAGDGSISQGKSKIMGEWKQMFRYSSRVFERLPEEITLNMDGDMAWEKGSWDYKNDKFFGNYAAMWKKINGLWLIQYELYVSLS